MKSNHPMVSTPASLAASRQGVGGRGWSWRLWALLLGLPVCVQAQWQTQSVLIKPGWTAIYLHVNASYASLDSLVGSDPSNPIAEVWLWQAPSSTLQFVTSPQAPASGNSQWANWARQGLGISGNLVALQPNAAYLIHSLAATNYAWHLQGQPVAPYYTWTTTGLNLLGFPTPSENAPAFDAFSGAGAGFCERRRNLPVPRVVI